MIDLRERLQNIFREAFDDDAIVLRDDTTAKDIEGWDSLGHINLIISIERKLRIKFSTAELSLMQQAGENFGSFQKLIEKKLASA